MLLNSLSVAGFESMALFANFRLLAVLMQLWGILNLLVLEHQKELLLFILPPLQIDEI